MTIGQRIKARRNELRLSQRDLAARLGYTDHTTLTRIEGDRVDLPQSRIVAIADALGVTPGYIMGWEDQPDELGAVAAEVLKRPALLHLVQDYLTMDAADQATVSTLAASLAAKNKKG